MVTIRKDFQQNETIFTKDDSYNLVQVTGSYTFAELESGWDEFGLGARATASSVLIDYADIDILSPVIPDIYHLYLVDYAKGCMAEQEKEYQLSDRFMQKYYANRESVRGQIMARVQAQAQWLLQTLVFVVILYEPNKSTIIRGLITNADPEDLDKQFTPHTHNFDTSQAGTLKRREIATRVKILEDRGFSSMFLFRNKNLANASGAEWLIYCNQRGIIYRMDRFYNDLLLDSYVENVLQYNPSSVPPGQDFLFLLPTEDSTIPQDITFQPFGEYILVGMGHDYPAKVIQAIDNRKMFLGKYTKSTGVYIEDFYGVYPTTYTLTASAQTTMGTLVEGDYYILCTCL